MARSALQVGFGPLFMSALLEACQCHQPPGPLWLAPHPTLQDLARLLTNLCQQMLSKSRFQLSLAAGLRLPSNLEEREADNVTMS